ncbi:MAG TPA: UPF0149 family protein [Rhodanobacteraceae bacterium]|nr:UPF0149 family protein [Rhodanobacteraceae bacterium]
MHATTSRIDHARLAAALEHMRVGATASDVHASLVGFLCAGGEPGEPWLASLQLQAETTTADDRAVLAELLGQTRIMLDAAAVEPLLPAADVALGQRVQALVDWCRGFLGGLGLAGADPAGMPEVAADVVADFARIAAGNLALAGEDEGTDEAALADLCEFAGDGVALLRTHLNAPLQLDRRHGA